MKKISLKQFNQKLASKGYIVTDKMATANMWLAITDRGNGHIPAVILDGPPGVGKTFLAEKTAEVLDAEVVFFQFYRGAGKEDLLFDLDLSRIIRGMAGEDLPKDFSDMVSFGVLPKSIQLSQKKKAVLILDEMDKSHPSTDAMLLDFLQSARLSIPHIGTLKANTDNLLVVFTKNDERDLSEPLLRRCRPVVVSFPPNEVESKMIKRETNCPTSMAKALVTIASKVRKSGAFKIPSTPELIRLAKDMMLLFYEGAGDIISDLVFDTFFPDHFVPETIKFDKKQVGGIFLAMLRGGK